MNEKLTTSRSLTLCSSVVYSVKKKNYFFNLNSNRLAPVKTLAGLLFCIAIFIMSAVFINWASLLTLSQVLQQLGLHLLQIYII